MESDRDESSYFLNDDNVMPSSVANCKFIFLIEFNEITYIISLGI